MANTPFTVEEHVASDGYRWRYRRYSPSAPARGQVVCLHGIQSHAGWYDYSCSRLSQAGFTVSFLDRRGSGANAQARGDAPSFRRLLDDIAEFLKGPQISGHGPVFVVGISWGGKLAAALERRHPGLVNGMVLLCPGFSARVKPSLGQRLRILGARFFRPAKFFPIPLDNPELFTANPRWQKFLRDDPLSLHQATARLLLESARLDGYLRFSRKYVHCPVLLLLAEKDRIIHNERTRRFVEGFPAPEKKVIEYAGAHHTLEFEPEPDRFIDDMIEWLSHCYK